MPSNLKKMVRARMAATGEGWAAALRHVRAQETAPGYRCDWDGCAVPVARNGDFCREHACNCHPEDNTGGVHTSGCPQFDPMFGAEPVRH